MDPKIKYRIENILHGDESKFGHLFPHRKSIPKIDKNIFTDITKSDLTIDKFVVNTMMDIRYIGWTAKVLLNVDLFPMQIAILQTMWHKPFPMFVASRGSGKSFLLAIYSILKSLLDPGVKIVIVGAGFRQAKLVFDYVINTWKSAPVLQDILGGHKYRPKQGLDQCKFVIGDSSIVALPLGTGEKIRGYRGNIVLADEFSSIPPEIFDIVVRGFAATTKSPMEEARRLAAYRKLKELDMAENLIQKLIDEKPAGNQIVYSGTAYYAFNHFAKRYEMWKKIIETQGDKNKITEIFGSEANVPENFDWKDYCVIRLPHTHVQEGLLDTKQLSHAKAILPDSVFQMEYCAEFISDSNGFFKRSLIESCTTKPDKAIETPDGPAKFSPLMNGRPKCTYIMGIDPAAEVDNFAIVISEVLPNHMRVVYCWSVNKDEFKKRKEAGLVTDDDYYAYCCHKVRSLAKKFNISRIELDSQGGGYAISEMLRNKALLKDGEFPIYEIIEHDHPNESDGYNDGPHIIHLVKATTEWNTDSNLFMHKSFETKQLLFPSFNPIKMNAALIIEKSLNVTFDTYEDCVNEIEKLKDEICMIQITETATGKVRFETQKILDTGNSERKYSKGRLRKDRYSALLLSHRYYYDTSTQLESSIDYNDVAGNISKVKADPGEGMYRGPGLSQMKNYEEYNQAFDVFGAIKDGKRLE